MSCAPLGKRASTSASTSCGRPSSVSATTSSTPLCDTSCAFDPNQRRSSSHSASRSSSSRARSALAISELHVRVVVLPEQEPEEAAGRKREQVRELADPGEPRAPEHLLGPPPLVG